MRSARASAANVDHADIRDLMNFILDGLRQGANVRSDRPLAISTI
jgi:hypothetical protein